MEVEKKEYFVVCRESECGWHSGGPSRNYRFIEASTPEEALEKYWESIKKWHFCNYWVYVYASSDDYHRNSQKFLATKYQSGKDPFACGNPDCSRC